MMVYKLSRNSVYRALLHEYTPEIIERFLEEHSKSPLPQNVTYSIAHWGTSYGRIEFEDVILLKCDSDDLADELMMSPKIKPYLKKKVGPCYLVVERDSYESLIAALSDEGYMPKVSTEPASLRNKPASPSFLILLNRPCNWHISSCLSSGSIIASEPNKRKGKASQGKNPAPC